MIESILLEKTCEAVRKLYGKDIHPGDIGIESRKSGKEWASEKEKDFIRNIYHRPADNYDPEKYEIWD